MLMRDRKLLEKHAAATDAGALKVNWAKFGGAGAMNDALLSVKSSIQAIVLQMAAAQRLGKENYAALDKRTVSMSHPDAMVALLSGKGEVSAHFTSPPFQFQALAKPGIHRVLSSRDIVGDASFVVAYTTSRFYKSNPRIYAAFARALDEAIALIRADKQAAAETYLRMTNGKEAELPSLLGMLNDPDMVFDLTPKGSMKYAEFMHGVGTVKTKPVSWKDFFFPNTHSLPGS